MKNLVTLTKLKKAASRVLTNSLSSLIQMPNRARFIYQFEDLTVDAVGCDDGVVARLHLAEMSATEPN